jgi:hypothetical protein
LESSRARPYRLKRPLYQRKRWLAIAIPLGTLVALVAIAPPLPPRPSPNSLVQQASPQGKPFRYLPDQDVFALDFDPRKVRIGLLEGWDREQEAYRDPTALAYVSGPMYERHVNSNGQETTVPLGDIKLGDQVWRGTNRTAARQRAYVGIRHDGHVDFDYGELTPKRAALYDTFIGGLHSIYNDLEAPPAAYKGAYSISMGQQIRLSSAPHPHGDRPALRWPLGGVDEPRWPHPGANPGPGQGTGPGGGLPARPCLQKPLHHSRRQRLQ